MGRDRMMQAGLFTVGGGRQATIHPYLPRLKKCVFSRACPGPHRGLLTPTKPSTNPKLSTLSHQVEEAVYEPERAVDPGASR